MGTTPLLNTALASSLYRTLLWQLAILVVITIAVTLFLVRRAESHPPTGTHEPEPLGRRVLRFGLGGLWIIAGLLQAQPAMPASFVAMVVKPELAEAPGWLNSIAEPFVVLWTRHPVAADAFTVWLQVGIGVAIIIGGRGLLSRIVLVGSMLWAAFIWLVGEVAGGAFASGWSWLTGAPGAALLYIGAAGALLLPMSWWMSGRAASATRRGMGVVFVLGAVLQVLPRGNFTSPATWAVLLSTSANGGMPGFLAWPITHLTNAIAGHASTVNALLFVVLVVVGVALLLDRVPKVTVAVGAGVTFVAWWFVQGFGVFGGVATDPNTGAVALVLLASAWPYATRLVASDVDASAVTAESSDDVTEATPVVTSFGRTMGIALAVGVLVVLPVVAALGFFGTPATQGAVGDSGGFVKVSGQPIPDFTLVDQRGIPVSTAGLRGKLVLISFLDPECYDSCPLLANQMANAMDLLGNKSNDVELVAIDVNPYFNKISDTKIFTNDHGLTNLPNWHFVTGTTKQVADVIAGFGQGVSIPRVGMIGHPSTLVLVGRDGQQLAVLNDNGNENLTQSYEQLLASTLRHYL